MRYQVYAEEINAIEGSPSIFVLKFLFMCCTELLARIAQATKISPPQLVFIVVGKRSTTYFLSSSMLSHGSSDLQAPHLILYAEPLD